MKEAILAITLAVLFAILGAIAEYKYNLILKLYIER
jgi:hypothetical protein